MSLGLRGQNSEIGNRNRFPDKAEVSGRLQQLAADQWEDDEVWAEAKRRAAPV
jgi:hypothetical protein